MTTVTVFHHLPPPIVGVCGVVPDRGFQAFEKNLDCAPGAGREPRDRKRFCCASEVGAGLDLAALTVSYHLKEVRQAGLVHVERHGRRIDCWVSEETLGLLASSFAGWASRRPGTRSVRTAGERGGAR